VRCVCVSWPQCACIGWAELKEADHTHAAVELMRRLLGLAEKFVRRCVCVIHGTNMLMPCALLP